MLRPLFAFLTAIVVQVLILTGAAAQSADLTGASVSDLRVLQAALILGGDYDGALDGRWGPQSRTALADYRARRGAATDADALRTLVEGFEEERRTAGWAIDYFSETGISIAQPLGMLQPETSIEGHLTLRSRPEGLILRRMLRPRLETISMHDWAQRNHRGPGRPTQVLGDELMETAVELEGGTRLYLRSDRVESRFATILVQGMPDQRGRHDLIVASLQDGRQTELVIAPEGRVAQIIGRVAAPPPGRPVPRPEPPPETADAVEEAPDIPDDDDHAPLTSSGTGFFVTADAMVTAAHVVRGCIRVTLEDGTPVTLIAEDPRRDLAVLRVDTPSATWLRLQVDVRPRLGQTVAAVGFPFYRLAGEEIVLTTGNISSILDAESSADRIMISAPVQPGNSGGPLLSAGGEVVGMVAARADDAFFLEMTGTMPQDMNFAIRLAALREFLEGAGIALPEDGVIGMPITEGLAEDAQAAIRPVLCELPDEF